MDFEIDIEEHDVLDNPVIKTIFPDISVIKKEITQYFEEEATTKEDTEIRLQQLSKAEDIKSNENHFQKDMFKSNQNKPLQPMQSNKIILGSKPESVTNNNYKQNVKHNLCSKPYGTLDNNSKKLILGTKPNAADKQDYNRHCNILSSNRIEPQDENNKKLILGSKPNTVAQDDTKEKCRKKDQGEMVKFKHMRLILQDIKSYLNQNGRYCKQCCRLFLSKHALDIHKNKEHHNKVLINKNIFKKIHYTETSHSCSICSSNFCNRGNLYRHYRSIHQKNIKKLRKDTKITSETDKYQISNTNIRLNKIKNKVCKNISKNKNIINKIHFTETRHKCNICGSYFSNRGNLCRHNKNFHQKDLKLVRKDTKTSFETDKYKKSNNTNPSNRFNEIETKNEKKQITTIKTIQSKYKCNICKVKLTSYCTLQRHHARLHKTKLDKEKSKDLIVGTYSKEKQEIESSIQNDLVTQVSKVATYDKKYSETTVIEKGKVIPAREKHEDIFYSKDNSMSNIRSALKDPAKKLEAVNKLDTAKASPFAKAKYKAEFYKKKNQVLSANKRRNIASVHEDYTSKYVTRARNSSSKDSNLCLHCKKVFPDQKSLVEHMYEILEPKRNSSVLNKNVAGIKKKEDDKTLFVCRQCSYYLPNTKAYFAHMVRNHKTEKFMDVLKEEFDAQCKYCLFKSSSITTHNKHVRSYHIDLMFLQVNNEIENNINSQRKSIEDLDTTAISELSSFALESVLFECNKCSICFLSSNVARHHKEHMELLINWKCSICHRILKKQDEVMHLKQHSFSQPIKVLNLNETAICNVLYNCTKCAIHFTEKRYQEHYPICGSDTTDSSYCSICDILVDKMEMVQHKTQHEHIRDISEFTIIDSNIIEDINTTNISLKRKGTITAESEVRPRKRPYEHHNCLTYCHTCESFLSNLALKNISHAKGNCSHLHTYACDICGLVFTSSSLQIHKERHVKEKHLKLQDYKFFNLEGKQVRPPIPKYPHCEICKVHFLRKNAIARHICDETDFLTCDICNIKLSEKTFKMHMSFHFYVIHRTQTDSSSTLNASFNTEVTSSIPGIAEISKESIKNEAKYHRKAVISKTIKETENLKTVLKPKNKLHHNYIPSESTDIFSNASHENTEIADETKNTADLVEEHNTKKIPNDDFLVVLYTCKTCGVTVESYDEVINHCQTHYSARENNLTQITSVKKCSECSLNFDSRFYLNHQNSVHSVSKIKVLKFDPCYFTSKNVIWVKHVFQTLTDDMIKELLKNSMYQHEHRIQFECIQKGSSILYVYKCDMCGNFIDPGNVYKHSKNPCGKVRKHPCSICGLPFISTFSRFGHEKLHNQIKSVTKNSLNIILFNQKKDKPLNSRIFCTNNQYRLYQCRNCDRVAEKTILTDHVCDQERSTLVRCITCGLLISKEDLKTHLSKHTDLGNFYSENFKVILFGCKNNDTSYTDSLKTLLPCFSGTVYDYSLYKCKICEICHRNKKSIENHICTNSDLDRSKCFECGLYFPSSCLKNHMKQHRIDPDFNMENINVILFNNNMPQTNELSTEKATKFNAEIIINDSDDDDNKKHSNDANIEKNIDDIIEINDGKNENNILDELSTEKATKAIFDNEKEKRYYNVESNWKSFDDSKYKSLDDSKDIDIHDLNKKYVDKFNDNSVNDGQKNSIGDCHNKNVDHGKDMNVENDGISHNVDEHLEALYKCKCGLHFLDKEKVIEHLKKCQPKAKQYKQNCSKCQLLFNPSELFSHLLVHHRDKTKVQNFKILEILIDVQDDVN